jgi:hypothetical protein
MVLVLALDASAHRIGVDVDLAFQLDVSRLGESSVAVKPPEREMKPWIEASG